MKVLTAPQMRELDQFTVQTEPLTSLDLMERASVGVVSELTRRWGRETRFVVFAGPGNNGGDALAVSRLLVGKG
ncbi:MAG: bifunctional ADP-dependent NAD(P)H-hydrate dehydratase/NAD(P)H-hydrate epimerase, partial [Bacteroidaceae bacterium]|nr:bifunctional ADP-dependent NAD(P)H-hydrate dehydratase/NAD(P)H-hydrate epimerase [Bacteroidaceae bacterium]